VNPALSKRLNALGPIIVLALLLAALSISVPSFLTTRNLSGLLLSVSLVGAVATTMMLVLALREVDLSVGSLVALAGVVTAEVISNTGNVAIGVVAGLGAGAAIGLINGLVVAKLKINSLIATLAMMQIVRGLAFLTSNGEAVLIPEESFYVLGVGAFLGVSVPVWITLFCFLLFAVVLNATVFGKNVLAIGGNPEAARLAGVPVDRVKIIVFTVHGLVTALAGVVLAARITSGQPNTSLGLELQVISACVLGGVSLAGGVATIGGVIVGVMIMGATQNALNLMGVPTFYQFVVNGGILLIAVILDQLRQRVRLQARPGEIKA
jgi:L-arabinose transport system permease protein